MLKYNILYYICSIMGRKGDNMSVYASFEFQEELEAYSKSKGLSKSKALTELAKVELDKINKDKRIIEKYNGKKRGS